MKTMLNKAITIAAVAHDGQFDKSGMPYILHVLTVQRFLHNDEDEELNCIALLHDVIEDTDITFEDLIEAGMTERVITGVRLMTKMPGQTAKEYLDGILTNKDAIRVKMADLRHNMDIRRLKGVTEKDMKRLEKYAKMYTVLKEAIGND